MRIVTGFMFSFHGAQKILRILFELSVWAGSNGVYLSQ
jgi:hypothetical protein